MDAALQFVPMMIVGFALSLGLTPLSRQIAMRLGVVDKPNQRKIHIDHKPLMGGLAIYVAFALALLVFSPPQHLVQFGAIVAGAGLLALTGLLDDRYNLRVRTRLLAMVTAAAGVVLSGIQINFFHTPLLDIPITIFWIVALTNAINFLDNMDGLAAGLSSIAAGFFLLLALSQGQVLVSMLAAALMGSAVGFLAYNFNPASTFMGDMGALVLGFVLAVLAILLRFNTQPPDVSWLVPVFVLAVPIFDINLVVWTRLAEGRSIGQAGRDHSSHRLMALGLTQRRTLLAMYSASFVFGLIGLVVSAALPDVALLLGLLGLGLLAVFFALMIWIRQTRQKGPQHA